MTDIVAFLNARIDEDEAVAQAASSHSPRWRVMCPEPFWDDAGCPETPEEHADHAGIVTDEDDTIVYDEGRPSPDESQHIARHDPARVLAECGAKRRIVADFIDARDRVTAGDEDYVPRRNVLMWVLGVLAAIDADHPDYDPAWAL